MTLSSLSNFITTRLGRMKAWATCYSLDWVTCYHLHFTLAYIVYRESRTRQVVYIKCTCALWRPRWNIHWYGQSFDWFVTLLHYLLSNKKKLVAKPELLISCHPNERQPAVLPPRQHPMTWESPQMSGQFNWSDCPLNDATESGCPRSWKIEGSRGFCKIRAAWTVHFTNRLTTWLDFIILPP